MLTRTVNIYLVCSFFCLTRVRLPGYVDMFQHLVNPCSHVGVDLKIVVLYLNYEIVVHEATCVQFGQT